jgi:hypothetical protein
MKSRGNDKRKVRDGFAMYAMSFARVFGDTVLL